jgi:hypothetical protein
MQTMKRLERAVFAICAVVLVTGFATPRDKHPKDRYEMPVYSEIVEGVKQVKAEDTTDRADWLLSMIPAFLDAPLPRAR